MVRRPFALTLVMLAVVWSMCASGLEAPARAQGVPGSDPPAALRLGFFTRSLATLAAQAEGFDAAEGVAVEEFPVSGSRQAFQFLRDGLYDIVLASADNPVNFRLNPHNATGAALDVRMFMGADYGMNLTLVAQPGLTRVEDLRGKALAVDAPDSGFAFVLYKIMRLHGLERDVDYAVVSAGGTPARFSALLSGQFDATLLNSGFELRAAAAGRVLLDSVGAVASPYLGQVFSATVPWLVEHEDAVVRFTRAYVRAVRWARDPSNREAAIALLATQPNTSGALAEQIYAVQVSDGVGLIPEARIDRKGLYNVLALRAEFNGFEMHENLRRLSAPAGGLFDLSFYRAALRDLRRDAEDPDTDDR
jgi:ABC-type nitrate/sulfonate/bicarbonate transport system substrate-binding protein